MGEVRHDMDSPAAEATNHRGRVVRKQRDGMTEPGKFPRKVEHVEPPLDDYGNTPKVHA